MIACFSPEHRGRLVLVVLMVVALAGGVTWIVLDPPWSQSIREVSPTTPTGTALTVNGVAIGYKELAIAARRAETSYLESRNVSASYLSGANGAFVRLVLLREATVNLVQQAIVVQEAKARKIEIADKKIDEETQNTLTQLTEQSRSSGSDISSILLEVGQSLDEFTEALREETRVRLLSDEVAVAVIGTITLSDAELRALYEAKKATYGADYDKAKDRVRSDYNREEVARRREQWLAAQLEQAQVKILDPILAAFDKVRKADDTGLADLERLWQEKRVYDPYLPYYIARIHNDRAIAAFAERQELEKTLGKTPAAEQTTQLEAIRAREKDSVARAISSYVATLKTAPADSDLLRRIQQLNPPAATRSLAMGLSSLLDGSAASAQSQLEEAIKLDAGLAVARIGLGDLAAKKGDPAGALNGYREAAAGSPKDVDVLLAAGDACLSIAQPAEAEKLFRSARTLAPEYARLWVAEGDLALSRLNDAAAERDRLTAQTTRTPAEDARRSALEKIIGDLYSAAREGYTKALARAESESALVKVGKAELLVGKDEEAMAAYRQVLARSTHYPEAHVGLGDVLARRGETDMAFAHYEFALSRIADVSQQIGVLARILNIEPTNGTARTAYGIALTRLGRWSEAIAELSRILEVQPDLVQVHLWIAESYAALGDYAKAITHLKAGLGPTATPAAKDSACAQIVTIVKRQVDGGGTPSSDALDALIDVARYWLGSGSPGDTVETLALLATIDPEYRQAEVQRLLQAAKTAPTKQQGSGTMD